MAEIALTGVGAAAPTGIFPIMSRRALVAGAIAAPVLAFPALAKPSIEDRNAAFLRGVADSQKAANDKFWKLYDDVKRIDSEFDAAPHKSFEEEEADTENYHRRSLAAINRALLQGVFSAAAVHAKLKLTKFDPSAWELPGIAENAAQMIEWDLERCAKVEWVARSMNSENQG